MIIQGCSTLIKVEINKRMILYMYYFIGTIISLINMFLLLS